MKASSGYIEKIYATVLFELAKESGTLGAVKEDLDSWTEICSAEKDFEKLIVSPYFSAEYKQQLVQKVFAGKVTELTLHFLLIVIRHDRTGVLSRIIKQFHLLWQHSQGYCNVAVTVAKPITDENTQDIAKRISEMLEKLVNVQIVINPDIIGGVVIRYDDKVIDNSVRTKLMNTAETILNRGRMRISHEV
jgi:F-type H+-transporting ATPase subunit delta